MQNGPESCSTPANSNFVLVDIPLVVAGEGPRGEAEYRYRIGGFQGRVVPWSLEEDPAMVVRLRIPKEKFHTGADLLAEVLDKASGRVLWRKSWKASWRDDQPVLEPSPSNGQSEKDESEGGPRYYRSG